MNINALFKLYIVTYSNFNQKTLSKRIIILIIIDKIFKKHDPSKNNVFYVKICTFT